MDRIEASGEIAADLAFMETLRRMRARFQSDIVTASASAEPDVTLCLRQESFFQVAEFFYAIRSYGIDSPEKLERLARLHNEHLTRIGADRERMRRYGLTPARIKAAVFAEDHLKKLLSNFSGPAPAIDQSDLARLLATVMSTETCRKLLVAAEKAGFIERVRSPFGAVLVVSREIMERIYGETLREARRAAAGA
jgi:hypothetical protein